MIISAERLAHNSLRSHSCCCVDDLGIEAIVTPAVKVDVAGTQ